MPLTGKVAAILTDDSVVVNLGRLNKVTPGMNFAAVYETGEIRDPDNPNLVLGSITYEIARITVTAVFEKMAICSVPKTTNFGELSVGMLPTKSRVDPLAERVAEDALAIRVGTKVLEVPPEASTGGNKGR